MCELMLMLMLIVCCPNLNEILMKKCDIYNPLLNYIASHVQFSNKIIFHKIVCL